MPNSVPVIGFEQTFVSNSNGILVGNALSNGTDYGTVTRTASGVGGITAPDNDGFYAILKEGTTGTANAGPFTRFGGYTSEFIDNQQTSVRVYLDPAWAANQSFQYTVAANGTNGAHLRDFGFQVRANGNAIEIGAANGATSDPITSTIPNATLVTTAGWYTLQQVFHNVGGVLSVDMNLINADGVSQTVATLTNPADTIGGQNGVVGGIRYGWFTDISLTNGLAVDDYAQGAFSGRLAEGVSTSFALDGGFKFMDADLPDAHGAFFVASPPANAPAYIGTFTTSLTNDSTGDGAGAVNWHFSATAAEIESLAAGTVKQVYTITVFDGAGGVATKDVTVTLVGANDAPVFGFLQDFKTDTNGILVGNALGGTTNYGSIDRVASGTNGIVAPDGDGFYAVVKEGTSGTDDVGPFTRFSGYTSEFIDNQQASIRVYLDPAWATNQSFQYSVAVNNTSGSYLDEYGFQVRANGSTIEVSAGNGLNFSPLTSTLPNPTIVTTAGWYTLQHVFKNVGGVLSVDMNLVSADGISQTVATQTKPGNTIGADGNVGGIRYGWFTDVSVTDGLAVDDYTLGALTGRVIEAADGVASPTYTSTGVIGFRDVDSTDTHTVTSTPVGTGYVGTFTPSVSNESTNDGSGAVTWSFSANKADLDHLAAGQMVTQSYVITVNDGHGGTSSQTVNVVLVGANDAPVVAAPLTASVAEDALAMVNLLAGASDVDTTDTLSVGQVTYSVNGATVTSTAPAGVTLSGSSLTVDATNAAYQKLSVGQTSTIVVSYNVLDNHGGSVAQTETITITGTNDAPVLGFLQDFKTDTNGILVGNALGGTTNYGSIDRVASGINGIVAPDGDGFYAVVKEGTSGTDDVGPFTRFSGYTSEFIDNQQASIRVYLDPAWATNQSFQYSVAVNNTGGSYLDEYGFQVRANGSTIEVSAGNGLNFSPLTSTLPNPTIVTTAGWYTLQHVFKNVGGVLSVDMNLVDASGVSQTVATQTKPGNTIGADGNVGGIRYGWFTDVSVTDGLAVDDYTLGALTGRVVEAADSVANPTYLSTGVIGFRDIDAADVHSVSATPVATGYVGTFTPSVSNDSNGDGTGAVTWTFNANKADLDRLAVGQTVTQSYVITVNDGHGGTSSQTVNVVLVGANDAPIVAAALTATVAEDASATVNLLAGASDVDTGDTLSIGPVTYSVDNGTASSTAPAGVSLSGSSLTVDAGNAAYQHLAVGQTSTIRVSYNVLDNHGSSVAQTETITITGTNDAPVANNDTAAVVQRTSVMGQVLTNDTDIDTGDILRVSSVAFGAASLAVTTSGTAIAGNYGTLTLLSDGTYSYVANKEGTLAVGSSAIDDFTYVTSDNHGGSGTAHLRVTVTGSGQGDAGNNIIVAAPGNNTLSGGAGDDTVVLGFKLVDASISYDNLGHVILDGPNGSHNVLSGFERYQFTDGTVNENTGSALVDDLYYNIKNKDVWIAHLDPETHYNQTGWHEGRDPNAEFSTVGYLAANADVRTSGVNPLTHYDKFGWKEGRDPAANFDNELYLSHNADVKAAGIDPLLHYLQSGQAEGRQTYTAVGTSASLNVHPGFDAEYYLLSNADVARAALSNSNPSEFAYQHYQANGFHEGRNPNAVFDTKGYLAAYTDVAASGTDPLAHYHNFGYKEGRDPSATFDTKAYLQAYADVAAAHIDPMLHYLQSGALEGRSTFSDGHFG